jgi:hypothetical protein
MVLPEAVSAPLTSTLPPLSSRMRRSVHRRVGLMVPSC